VLAAGVACNGEAPANAVDAPEATPDAGRVTDGPRDTGAAADALDVGDADAADAQPPTKGGWLPLIARTKEQFNLGIGGGSGMQFFRSWATSPARPDRVIGTEDIGVPMMTDDFGAWWDTPPVAGLKVGVSGQGAWVDPQNADRIIVVYSASSRRYLQSWRDQAGIYLSTDGAKTFKLVQPLINASGSGEHGSRHMQHPVAAAPGGTPATRTLYCFHTPRPKGGARQDGALYRSTNGGASWSVFGEKLTVAKFGDTLTTLRAAPNGDLYLASDKGVFRSTNGGTSWTRSTGLAAGQVREIDVRGGNGEAWACVDGKGLYESTDHGATWKQNAALGTYKILTFAISPANRKRICVAGDDVLPRYSHDGGQSWSNIDTQKFPGQDGGFSHLIKGTHAYFIWHEANPQLVLAQRNQHMGKSTDGGKTFVWASNNFDYSLTHGHGFHPTDWTRTLIALQDRLTLYTETAFDWVHDDGVDETIKVAIRAEAGVSGHIGGSDGALILVNGSHTGLVTGAGNGFTRTPVVHQAKGGNPIGKPSVPALANVAAMVWGENDRADPAVGYTGRWRVTLNSSGDLSFTDINHEFVGCGKAGGVIFGVDKNSGSKIYHSTDGGTSWTTWATAPVPFRPIDSKPVVRVDPTHAARVYTSSASGKMFKIEGQSKPTTTKVFDLVDELGSGLPGYEISDIAVDYFDGKIIYVASNTYGGPCVFRSTDGGQSWQDITGNSPHQPGPLWVHPHTSDLIRSSQHGTHIFPPPAGHRAAHGIPVSLYDRVKAYLTP
jgi:photosystem II stability/assembly factor-like uncharacterized protein